MRKPEDFIVKPNMSIDDIKEKNNRKTKKAISYHNCCICGENVSPKDSVVFRRYVDFSTIANVGAFSQASRSIFAHKHCADKISETTGVSDVLRIS